MSGIDTAVSACATHDFSKPSRAVIRLLAGRGVEGDAHLGETVKHRSRVARNSQQPNLRQVHLIHAELHQELAAAGFSVSAGQMGENITTRGIDLLALPAGARLRFGAEALIELTGLRNPCAQLDAFQPGLMAAVLGRDAEGRQAKELKALADDLGDDHDLVVLQQTLKKDPGRYGSAALRKTVIAAAEKRQKTLRAQAAERGRRIYAESPKAFVKRLERYDPELFAGRSQ